MEDFNMMMIHRMSTYVKPTLLESGKRGSARIDPDDIDIEGGAGAEYFDEEDVGKKEDYDEYYDQELHIRVKRAVRPGRDYHSGDTDEEYDYESAEDSCQYEQDFYWCGNLCLPKNSPCICGNETLGYFSRRPCNGTCPDKKGQYIQTDDAGDL